MTQHLANSLTLAPFAVVSKAPPPVRTEAEIALARAEKSRRRKSQADKKLEDEVSLPSSLAHMTRMTG